MKTISHKFVEFIPELLENDTIYITIEYSTAVHKCFCGCGNKVVTPLSPTDWRLIYDGETLSLYPSIGNWNFDCRSHYWIENDRVVWAEKWSKKKINFNRKQDRLAKGKYYGNDIEPLKKVKNKKNLFWKWSKKDKDK
mgnify:CR=1 FL=1